MKRLNNARAMYADDSAGGGRGKGRSNGREKHGGGSKDTKKDYGGSGGGRIATTGGRCSIVTADGDSSSPKAVEGSSPTEGCFN